MFCLWFCHWFCYWFCLWFCLCLSLSCRALCSWWWVLTWWSRENQCSEPPGWWAELTELYLCSRRIWDRVKETFCSQQKDRINPINPVSSLTEGSCRVWVVWVGALLNGASAAAHWARLCCVRVVHVLVCLQRSVPTRSSIMWFLTVGTLTQRERLCLQPRCILGRIRSLGEDRRSILSFY